MTPLVADGLTDALVDLAWVLAASQISIVVLAVASVLLLVLALREFGASALVWFRRPRTHTRVKLSENVELERTQVPPRRRPLVPWLLAAVLPVALAGQCAVYVQASAVRTDIDRVRAELKAAPVAVAPPVTAAPPSPTKPAPLAAQAGPISEAQLSDLVIEIRSTPFPGTKVRILRGHADRFQFTDEQAARVVMAFRFDDDKVSAVEILKPQLSPGDRSAILDVIPATFGARSEARRVLES
jgi:hypothetical protein